MIVIETKNLEVLIIYYFNSFSSLCAILIYVNFIYFFFSSQLSFSFNFFIHGESTVCASVDVRQRTLVCQLSRHHLSLAQGSHNGLKGKCFKN